MLPVFPTTYFGSIAYFKEICRYDSVIIEVMETFPKQTIRNRMLINTSNGHLRLTVPVEKPNGSKSTTGSIRIAESKKWRAEHWRAIKTAYSSAPYFDFYGMEVEELINMQTDNLVEFNSICMHRVFEWLNINIELKFSEDYIIAPELDYRNAFDDISTSEVGYIQVFNEAPHTDGISILDAIFCEGPLARNLLLS